MEDKYIFKLNIQSVINWEYLTNKSYFTIDFNDIDDINYMIYSSLIANNATDLLFDDFLEIINTNEKLYSSFTKKFIKSTLITEQFSKAKKVENKNESEINEEINEESNNKIQSLFIKDIVNKLIIDSKIDTKYLLFECDLNHFFDLMEEYNEHKKNELESKRFWTYLQILPHIDGKKISNPSKLIKFVWDEIDEDEQKEIKERFEDYFEIGQKILDEEKNNENIDGK